MKKRMFSMLIAILASLILCLSPIQANDSEVSDLNTWPGELRFQHLTAEDGLPNSTVLGALQDKDGFLWFATQDGLARYDGYTMKVFRQDEKDPNSLSANNIFALYEDDAGILWVGTDGGGLNRYDPESETFKSFQFDPEDDTSLSNNSIWSIAGDDAGYIWVGTRGGLNRFDPETETFKRYLSDEDNSHSISNDIVLGIYQDFDGVLWFGTRNGLNQYRSESDDFLVYVQNEEDETSLSDNQVWDILEDSKGNLWVATRYGGLNLLDRESGIFTAFRHDEADPTTLSDDHTWKIYEDRFGELWITTERGGLNRFDYETQSFMSYQSDSNDDYSLSDNDVFWMLEDDSGNFWVTSRRKGVNILSPSYQRFSTYQYKVNHPISLSSSNTYAIWSENESVFWVGTSDGLTRIDRENNSSTVYRNDPDDPNSLPVNTIYALWGDGEGLLWIGTVGGGLSRLEVETGKFLSYTLEEGNPETLASNYITAITPADEGNLWIGTLGLGLDLFNTQTGKVIGHYEAIEGDPNSLGENTIFSMVADQSGTLYVGTGRAGVSVLDPSTGHFTNYQHDIEDDQSLANDSVQALWLTQDGNLWCGTANGLSRMDVSTGLFTNYSTDDGLLNQTIFGILEDPDGDIWVSTGKGLAKYSEDTGTFRVYEREDGLQSNQFNLFAYHRGESGELFFGGPNGVNSFFASNLVDNEYQPKVNFIDFQLFNRTVAPGGEILPATINEIEEIVLTHEETVFTISFAATNYQVTSHNQYQYRLEGFDQDWSPPSDKREATYTNLSPGMYTFKVRACNNDGLWDEEGAAVRIKILPPWWETLWFQLLLLALISLLIIGGLRWRLSAVRIQNESLELRVKERTVDLEHEIESRKETEQKLVSVNVELKDQIEEVSLLRDQLHELSIRDELTGLYNRRHLNDVIDRELARARREGTSVCAVIIDVDHFKNVNDTYGHVVGDQILARIGALLVMYTRKMDIACRYGGEEFVIILPAITQDEAIIRAEDIRKKINRNITETVDIDLQVTISLGLAIFPETAHNSDDLLNNADFALYQSKRMGRNQLQVYSPEMRNSVAPDEA